MNFLIKDATQKELKVETLLYKCTGER